MTEFDFIVLVILALSSAVGLVRGFLKEILALVAYILAFIAALWYGPTVYSWLMVWIDSPLLRIAVAYITVFLIALLGVGVINMALSTMIHRSGLSSVDHGLGALFGLLRGVLIVLLLVVAAGYTPFPQEAWWRDALFSPMAIETIKYGKVWLPPYFASLLPY